MWHKKTEKILFLKKYRVSDQYVTTLIDLQIAPNQNINFWPCALSGGRSAVTYAYRHRMFYHLSCWKGTKIWKSVKRSDILSRCPSKWWQILFLSLFLSLSHIMVSWEEGSENNFALALTPTSRLLAVEAPPSQLYVVEWRRSTVNSVKLWSLPPVPHPLS